MLKRFIPVAECSNEFSGKQLQPQHMPIGQIVTCHNGLSPLNCHSLPEGEVCNGDFSHTLLYHWIPFTRVMEAFYFTGLFFYVSMCLGTWEVGEKICWKDKKKHYSRHGQQNYCIVCYSIHSYVPFIIIISVPSPVPFSSLAHCVLSFVS
jgi:hypothetical protein